MRSVSRRPEGYGYLIVIVRSQAVRKIAIGVGLIAATWLAFAGTLRHGFIDYDDPAYVAANPQIQAGLSWSNIVWAFTHIHSHNWHPLTTISHMLDCQLFGVQPAEQHLVNLLLHTFSVLLLFLWLEKVTGNLWNSAFVAALFAIHPLRVESVAWISERKDVLSGFFFVLTLIAYSRYTRQRTFWNYALMSILFVAGLLSKPMLVTVPLVLLLLDYWPLRRSENTSLVRLVSEKLPLFALALACSAATLVVQSKGDFGLVSLNVLPLAWRITNALEASFIYVRQMFWPAGLALGYSHPGKLPLWEIVTLTASFLAIMVGVLALRKRAPYLLIGWSWYLIMLLPVIGLVQVGGQSHADRYTYLPQIGLYIALTWAILDLTTRWVNRGPVVTGVGLVALAALTWRTIDQVNYWRDSETLWRHALAVSKDNDLAHLNLGMILADQKRVDDAIAELEGVVSRHPNDADARMKLANSFAEKQDRTNDAIREYEAVARIGPNPEAETELGNLLFGQGRIDEAIGYYAHVVQMRPSSALAHYNLAVGLHRRGQFRDAVVQYKEALKIDPQYPDAQEFLQQAEAALDQPDPRFRSKNP